MIVADTNVISELMRPRPEPAVLDWVTSLSSSEIAITAVTVEEIERGIRRMSRGKRQLELRALWNQLIAAYADTVLAYDKDGAIHAASFLVARERAGRTVDHADAQIAGTCLAHGATLATRNTKDFTGITGLTVINPF